MSRRLHPRLVATLALASGCGEASLADEEHAGARELLELVRSAGYPDWASETIEGDAPHGAWSVVFVDPIMQAALAGAERERWPEGATIVCEGRELADGDAVLTMIMRKQDEAWTWAQLDADDEPLVYGRAVGCVHCHASGDDFARSIRLP
ncbi:MAG: hypothetical protein IAG13_27665 [Deltaproteobacteria bacterium]|nr:hypothetical protein [Nannocystaceae bacterium]